MRMPVHHFSQIGRAWSKWRGRSQQIGNQDEVVCHTETGTPPPTSLITARLHGKIFNLEKGKLTAATEHLDKEHCTGYPPWSKMHIAKRLVVFLMGDEEAEVPRVE